MRGDGAALIGQEAAGEGGDDLPVGASLAEWRDSLVDELDAALGAGEGAGLFGEADAGEEDIGIAGGLGGMISWRMTRSQACKPWRTWAASGEVLRMSSPRM